MVYEIPVLRWPVNRSFGCFIISREKTYLSDENLDVIGSFSNKDIDASDPARYKICVGI